MVPEAPAKAENAPSPYEEPAFPASSSTPTMPFAATDTDTPAEPDALQREASESSASGIAAAVATAKSAIPEAEAQEMFPSPPPQGPLADLSDAVSAPDREETNSPAAEPAAPEIKAEGGGTESAIPEAEAQEMFPSPPPQGPLADLSDVVSAPDREETNSPAAEPAAPEGPTETAEAPLSTMPSPLPGSAVVESDTDFAAPADAMESNSPELFPWDTTAASRRDSTEALSSASTSPLATVLPSPFTVQIASLDDAQLAVEIVDNLKKKKDPAYCAPAQIPERGTWYRVYWGRFPDRSGAEEAVRRLRERHFRDPMVVRRPWSLVFDPSAPSQPELLARIGLAEDPEGRIGAFETESDARWAVEALAKEGLRVDIVGPHADSPTLAH